MQTERITSACGRGKHGACGGIVMRLLRGRTWRLKRLGPCRCACHGEAA